MWGEDNWGVWAWSLLVFVVAELVFFFARTWFSFGGSVVIVFLKKLEKLKTKGGVGRLLAMRWFAGGFIF